MVLSILEDIVDDLSVSTDVQKDSLVFILNVGNGKRTVPSERPSHGLEDKGKTSKTLSERSPEL